MSRMNEDVFKMDDLEIEIAGYDFLEPGKVTGNNR